MARMFVIRRENGDHVTFLSERNLSEKEVRAMFATLQAVRPEEKLSLSCREIEAKEVSL